MASFTIPVSWMMASTVAVEADSLEEAVEYAKEHMEEFQIDRDADWVEDSYSIDVDDLDSARIHQGNICCIRCEKDEAGHVNHAVFSVQGNIYHNEISVDLWRCVSHRKYGPCLAFSITKRFNDETGSCWHYDERSVFICGGCMDNDIEADMEEFVRYYTGTDKADVCVSKIQWNTDECRDGTPAPHEVFISGFDKLTEEDEDDILELVNDMCGGFDFDGCETLYKEP